MTDRGNEALAELAGRSVVVTGGAGFIGSRLARTLAAVCEVTVVDDCLNGDPAAVPESATLIRGDVRDVEPVQRACAEADVVFHQAAMTDVTRSVRAPGECHTRNASGTMTVLDVVRANLRAAVTDATGRAYNVATGEATAVRDLAALVRAATDTESGVTARPTRSADIERSRGAVARARDQLGFEAAVGLREGIAALADGNPAAVGSSRGD